MRSAAHMLEWRRNQVLELSAQGLNQSEVSKKIKVHQSVVPRDIKFLGECACKSVETHVQERIQPFLHLRRKNP